MSYVSCLVKVIPKCSNINVVRMSVNLASMRKAYLGKGTTLDDEKTKNANPYHLFQQWFELAQEKALSYNEANAVCIATSTKDGHPSARMVLLKGFDINSGHFTVFTNYSSRKGREIDSNPNVALLFHWDFLNRQVRVEGQATRCSSDLSDEYFQLRRPDARINARVSQQSEPVESRAILEKRSIEETQRWTSQGEKELEKANIPRPDNWGGYVIVPKRFEFWQGQSDRLHDRFQFDKSQDGAGWVVQRLQP